MAGITREGKALAWGHHSGLLLKKILNLASVERGNNHITFHMKAKCQNLSWKFFESRIIDAILYLAITSVIIIFTYEQSCLPAVKLFSTNISGFINSSLYYGLLAVISIIVWSIVIHFGGAPLKRNFPKNIIAVPTWIIAFVGTLLVSWLLFLCEKFQDYCLLDCLICAGIFFVSKLLFYFYREFIICNKDSTEEVQDEDNNDIEQTFIEWILSETPIMNEKDDRFGRKFVARKLSNLVIEGKNIVLVGDYGTGKTAVFKLMGAQIRNQVNPHYTICEIDAWGRRKSGELSKYILNSALNKLKHQIDILSFIGIPGDFANAVSDGSFWGNLLRIARRGGDPVSVLERLDKVLKFHNEKLLFIIEDVDRNNDDVLVKVELPAFLDRLSHIDNILFAVAVDIKSKDNLLSSSEYLYRIADNIQNLPNLDCRNVLENIVKMRNEMRRKAYVDPNTEEEYLTRLLRVYDIDNENEIKSGGRIRGNLLEATFNTPAYIIAKLLPTPRLLKSVFRETYQSWEKLAGEVNPDELLVLTTIKHSLLQLNNFLMDSKNLSFLQGNIVHNQFRANDKEYSPIKKIKDIINEEFRKEILPISMAELHILIDFLFPRWLPAFGNVPVEYMQSISISGQTDYWSRIARGFLEEKPLMDQDVLKKLKDFEDNQERGKEIAEKIVNERQYAGKIRQFREIISDDSKLKLGSFIFESILDLHKSSANENSFGFEIVRKLSRLKSIAPEKYNSWVIGEFQKALPISFRFADGIIAYLSFYGTSASINKDVYFECVAIAKKMWMNAQSFVDAIDINYPNTLFHFIVDFPGKGQGVSDTISGTPATSDSPCVLEHGTIQFSFYYHYWQWLAKVLIGAIKTDPKKVLPQIAWILVDFDEVEYKSRKEFSENNPSYVLDPNSYAKWFPEAGEKWFGEDFNGVLNVYSEFDDFGSYSAEVTNRMNLMKYYAEKYLGEKLISEPVSEQVI